MIYTDSQLKEKIVRMIESFENEVVEFKEARTNYSFNDIGKYFSALSNEANLRGLQEAWLIFGISDDKRYVGTEFRKQGSLQSLKKEIVNGTNERLTFLEIYELTMEKMCIRDSSYGVIRPVILMPKNTEWKNIYQLRYVLEHEYVDVYKRQDFVGVCILQLPDYPVAFGKDQISGFFNIIFILQHDLSCKGTKAVK